MANTIQRISKRERRIQRKLQRDLNNWRADQAAADDRLDKYLDPNRAAIESCFSTDRVNRTLYPSNTVLAAGDPLGGITQPTNYQYKAMCRHAGNLPVLDFGKCKIHAAAYWDLPSTFTADLVIDCAAVSHESVLHVPKGYEDLLAHVAEKPVPTVKIEWPDHGAPPLAFAFWENLYSLLPDGKVVVYCVGGHGRTGTALAALHIIHYNCGAQVAIDYVKKYHCQSAIETQSQRRYICQLAEWWSDQIHSKPKSGKSE